jgi:hypothetical protein
MDYSLSEETLGYVTSPDPSNTDKRFLVAGSKNVLVDYQKKVKSRSGYFRLGAANSALAPVRTAWTWSTSTGSERAQRSYDDELEVFYDGAWIRVASGFSTTEKLRAATWWDATENIDLQIMCNGNDNLYEWNGAIAKVLSLTGTTVTKQGTNTFAQDRFYTTRNKTFVCVRTGTEYTYTGGEVTTTLTGIADTAGLQVGDILVQKVITTTDKPAAGRNNYTIFSFENQIVLGSEEDEEDYISQNDDYDDFSFSSPRVPGEGGILTLDDTTRAISSLGKILLIFAGRSGLYQAEFETLVVSTTISETLRVKKLDIGIDQGALNQECVIPIGNSIAYLSNEVALRIISNPEDLVGIDPKTYSNPIKPDFDAEDWTGAFGIWYKSMLIFTSPVNSRMYMLNFVEDANGKVFRFWNPPQTLPVGPMSVIDSGDGPLLHGHSNTTPESYLLFDGQSDGQYEDMAVEDKFPIHAVAAYAYQSYGERARLKNLDEYYVEGDITPNTRDLLTTLNYDFSGSTQVIEREIDGAEEDILEGNIGFNSLAQQSLAINPLGGLLNPPSDARKFRISLELAKEDFHQIQAIFSTNEIDRYWAIVAHGGNVEMSKRKNTLIKK